MRPAQPRWALLAFVGLALVFSRPVNTFAKIAEEEVLGRALFEVGVHTTDEGTVQLNARAGGDAAWVMRGRAVACANCHGLRGEGGGEGFQRAPTLRWPEWSSSDPTLKTAARERLRSAIMEGRRADGLPLSPAMPRFDMDELSFAAISAYTEALVVGRERTHVPTLAVLRLDSEHAPSQERFLYQELLQCLKQRVGDRIQLLVHDVPNAEAAAHTWALWQARPDVLAVLAPPWRGWQPPSLTGVGSVPLPAVFPLVADPQNNQPGALWLLGGAQARLDALVQAWLADTNRIDGEASLPVWAGFGKPADERWRSMEDVAHRVYTDTGRRPRFMRMAAPQGDPVRAALWLDPERLPGAGWWLMPLPIAAQPAPDSHWWMAQPFAGTAQRPLAQRWADAVCITVEAGLGQGSSNSRADWVAQLAASGRLNDGFGWSWQVMTADPDGLGAVSAWTVVAFDSARVGRLVNPRVDLSRLRVVQRQRTTVSGSR